MVFKIDHSNPYIHNTTVLCDIHKTATRVTDKPIKQVISVSLERMIFSTSSCLPGWSWMQHAFKLAPRDFLRQHLGNKDPLQVFTLLNLIIMDPMAGLE